MRHSAREHRLVPGRNTAAPFIVIQTRHAHSVYPALTEFNPRTILSAKRAWIRRVSVGRVPVCAEPYWVGGPGHPERILTLSYLLYYCEGMAIREKRSISLAPGLAAAIDAAAEAEGKSVSAWIAATAAHRLRLDAGRRGIAEWEQGNGALTSDELADGLVRARALLGRSKPVRRRAS